MGKQFYHEVYARATIFAASRLSLYNPFSLGGQTEHMVRKIAAQNSSGPISQRALLTFKLLVHPGKLDITISIIFIILIVAYSCYEDDYSYAAESTVSTVEATT